MGEHKLRKPDLLLKPRWDYRVLELGVGDDVVLSIRRVDYDADGKPYRFHHVSPQLTNHTGDGLLALINDLAMALSRPSLLASEFEKMDA